MKKRGFLVLFILVCFSSGCKTISYDNNENIGIEVKLLPADDNKIYHAAFPGLGAPEDGVTTEKISNFETLAGKKITWVYFSNNWFNGVIKFPKENVKTIHKYGSVPFIRLMPRASYEQNPPDPIFTMQKIIDGLFDADLIQWADDARDCGVPLLAEFGTECNGQWFSWNAAFNGANSKAIYGDPQLYDGMERFRDAYRHIIDITKKEGANNITWFFHVNAPGDPSTDWNTMKGYYPGDNYIDWIGLSVYGAQSKDENWRSFQSILDSSWTEISTISETGKPIAILEWGTIENQMADGKAEWITSAMNLLNKGGKYYPYIKALSFWHSSFSQTNLRIDSSPQSLKAYQSGINDSIFTGKPKFSK